MLPCQRIGDTITVSIISTIVMTVAKNRGTMGLSRKQKYVLFLNKNVGEMFSAEDIYKKFCFNTDFSQVKKALNEAFNEGLIKITTTESGVFYHV